ncbi:MAG: hypothetical protein KGO05_11290 [Chloroflexota bacterium]|nr:hypothetical protein [Chloroflexota bacterium]
MEAMDPHMNGRNARWLRLALALTTLALLAGCANTTAVSHPPTETPTATETPQSGPAPVSGLLAPPPTDCQAVAEPHRMTLSADFGGGFGAGTVVTGGAPAWQSGLGTPLDLESLGLAPYPSTKVLWIIGPGYSKPVTLQGHDLRTGTPIWFALLNPGAENLALSVALDPAMPNRGYTDNSAGHWNIYGVGMTFTVAGCYELDVSWPEGNWRTVFAAGR